MGDINQDDIDKLLADAMGGNAGADEPAAAPAPKPEPEMEGVASQDDIDALFAAVGGGDVEPPSPPPPAKPAPAPAGEEEGVASQSDIDALFAAVGGDAPESEPVKPVAPEPPAAKEDEGVAGQDDIDALFAAVAASAPEPAAIPETETDTVLETSDMGGDLSGDSASIHELLAGISSPGDEGSGVGAENGDAERVDTVDMDMLLNQIGGAKPPVPAAKPFGDPNAATVILPPSALDVPDTQPLPRPPQAAPLPPPPAHLAPAPVLPPASPSLRDNMSVMSSAGEVESMASQISGMLGQLSEKAHRYMQAWLSADSETKELRARLHNEEHIRAVVKGEKDALVKELEFLRGKMGSIEGEKIGLEEARRTAEAALQSQIRELESRAKVQAAELESLKNELTRARTEATGVDIESRRARFEADRLKSEVESERMERLRIQRALENREKELQALQAQSAGQASSLFIDELHRLVRRLESELDARTSGAHEALRQLDRLEAPENMVPIVANLRAALMQALGADDSQDDALKSLGREAGRVRGPQGLAPGKTEMLSFESALSTYNLAGALEIAGALLREVKATPAALMRRIYQCPALRRQEVGEHLSDLSRLLEGLRTVQESADRARGGESGESEVFYVQMFDFLHNLVRLKLVNRLAGEIWRIFLDLRGRFSFVTSDKQWAEYRDGVLGDKHPA